MRWWKAGTGYVEQEAPGGAETTRGGSDAARARARASGTVAPISDPCLGLVRVLVDGAVVKVNAYRAARLFATGEAGPVPDMTVHEAGLVLTANDRRQATSLRTLATEERARANRVRSRFGTEG